MESGAPLNLGVSGSNASQCRSELRQPAECEWVDFVSENRGILV